MSNSSEEIELFLNSFLSNYTLNLKLQKLFFIDNKFSFYKEISNKILIKEIKKTTNITLFNLITKQDDWLIKTTEIVNLQLEKLHLNLKNNQLNFIKESIRVCFVELADFYYLIGDYSLSLTFYQKSTDYQTTSKHIVESSISIIKVFL